MQSRSENTFQSDKFIYSFQKALDETLALGGVPRRLFRVLYPIRVIKAFGRQRLAVDMEEILWFLERGIYEVGLKTEEELQIFFGLDSKSVEKLIGFLMQVGHIHVSGNELALTELGMDSVKESVFYQEQETNFSLYFEAFGNSPLPQEYFRIKMCEDISSAPGFLVFPPIYRDWDPMALQNLQKRADKSKYGVFEEVTLIQSSHEATLVYMPIYIVERMLGGSDTLNAPPFLVFSNVPGYRDGALEQAINQEPMIHEMLENSSEDMDNAIARRLNSLGIKDGSYYIKHKGDLGIEVVLDGALFTGEEIEKDDSGNPQPMKKTAQQIGKYVLASEWCFWLTCDDPRIRLEAGVRDCLEWLNRSYSDPTRDDVNLFIELVNKRLNISNAITFQMLQDEARKGSFARALDRLVD